MHFLQEMFFNFCIWKSVLVIPEITLISVVKVLFFKYWDLRITFIQIDSLFWWTDSSVSGHMNTVCVKAAIKKIMLLKNKNVLSWLF